MATSTSNEASDIRRRGRQRLIGAVALVLLLVVFVPMVLDSEPRPSRNEPSLTIPPKDNPPPLPTPAAAAKATEPPAKAEPPKAANVTPKLEGFAVQVGAFRDEDKLRQAREKLTGAGIAHYTERLDSQGGALTRLRAGPFASREAASAAAAKIEQQGFRPNVVSLD
jgi:DedD protein